MKTQELVIWKYSWPSVWANIKVYVKVYNICLTLKWSSPAFWRLLVVAHSDTSIKKFFNRFYNGFANLFRLKKNTYNSILVLVDQLTKIIYYKTVKIMIDAVKLAKVIIDVIVWYYGLLDLIIMDRSLLLNSKLGSLFCYFLWIKRGLFITFDL